MWVSKYFFVYMSENLLLFCTMLCIYKSNFLLIFLFLRNCSDYDLCETCEQIDGIHTPSHVFLKLYYPTASAGQKVGHLQPLLHGNIYEERETEREK